MNTVIIEGNLTRDPEMRYTPSGKAVTEFSVAVNEGFGEKRTTEYIDCQAWDRLAESVAETGRKGGHLTVVGRLTVDTWNDRETGRKRKAMKVTARAVAIEPPRAAQPEQMPVPMRGRQAPPQPTEDDDLDDLPF